MATRFRKSIKVAPGIKLNINKGSMSLSGGVKGAHLTANTKGHVTTSASLPGTGLSWRSTSGGAAGGKSPSSAAGQAQPMTFSDIEILDQDAIRQLSNEDYYAYAAAYFDSVEGRMNPDMTQMEADAIQAETAFLREETARRSLPLLQAKARWRWPLLIAGIFYLLLGFFMLIEGSPFYWALSMFVVVVCAHFFLKCQAAAEAIEDMEYSVQN